MATDPSAQPKAVTNELLDEWATDPKSAVALHLRQRLMPIDALEDGSGIVFPPTYADIGYSVDTLSDGTSVATIDSVGSQANRMEPLFKEGGPLASFVPQLKIKVNDGVTVSILDLAHRAADATVQASTLGPGVVTAFRELQQGDAKPLCSLAPTSLVFGMWDSRGDTGEKRPRLVRSVIRAWDVEVLHAAAQFNSVWKALDEKQKEELTAAAKNKGKDWEKKLSGAGLKDAPATFRKVSTSAAKYMQEFRDGSPNPERRVLGGVLVRGRIEREVSVNLVALRGLRGKDDAETKLVRQYLLGLTLLVATSDIEPFLREGCLLRHADNSDAWYEVPRRGEPGQVIFQNGEVLTKYTQAALEHFKPSWPNTIEYHFSIKAAKQLLSKRGEEEGAVAE